MTSKIPSGPAQILLIVTAIFLLLAGLLMMLVGAIWLAAGLQSPELGPYWFISVLTIPGFLVARWGVNTLRFLAKRPEQQTAANYLETPKRSERLRAVLVGTCGMICSLGGIIAVLSLGEDSRLAILSPLLPGGIYLLRRSEAAWRRSSEQPIS